MNTVITTHVKNTKNNTHKVEYDVWRAKYWHEITSILKTDFDVTSIRKSNKIEDTLECTDAVLTDINNNQIRIAIRLRNAYLPYRDLTIRKTLYPKIKHTDIEYYFLAWHTDTIIEYCIIDVQLLIKSGILNTHRSWIQNNDGTSFTPFEVAALPLKCIYQYAYADV